MGTIFQSWFSGPLGAALARLLNMSAAAGVLICAVVLLRFALRRAPKWVRCVLWALVAVQLVCPVTPASPLSVYGLLQGIDLSECLLFTTGRMPSDMVLKAVRSGVPLLASKTYPTDVGLALARRAGLTLATVRAGEVRIWTERGTEEKRL